MLRVWPQRVRGDGQFVARLRRAGEAEALWENAPQLGAARARRGEKAEGAQDARNLLEQICATAVRALPEPLSRARMHFVGGRLFAAPAAAPDTDGLRVIWPGTALLRAEKNRVEPEHALAMALAPRQALRVAPLGEDEARAFLAGESLHRAGEPGWTLVACAGLPLGWGKQADGALKTTCPRACAKRCAPEGIGGEERRRGCSRRGRVRRFENERVRAGARGTGRPGRDLAAAAGRAFAR